MDATDVYDVTPPAGEPREVTVALVHGGFWRARYDRHHLEPLAEALAGEGFHVANLEYPRVGMPRGGWPGTGAGVLARLEEVRADGTLPGRVLAVGHSAGGHLALWAASGGRAPWLGGVVALGAAADLGEVDRLHLSDDAARGLLGGAPEELPEAWRDADPARHRLDAPATLVTGERDTDVPTSVTLAYLATREPDEQVRHVDLDDTEHMDLVDPTHPAFATLLAELTRLTERTARA